VKLNKLIEELQKIKGNPDILLWNGLVGDAVQLDKEIQIDYQYRYSPEYFISSMKMDWCEANGKDFDKIIPEETLKKFKEEAKILSRKHGYDFPNPFFDEKDYERYFDKKKKVIILQPIIAGKTYQDRLGEITY